jgi:plastocyanin
LRKTLTMLACGTLFLASCGDESAQETTESIVSDAESVVSDVASEVTGGAPVDLDGDVNDKGIGDATSGPAEIDVREYSFAPTYLQVDPGGPVALTVVNNGDQDHTFTAAALGIDKRLAPGAKEEVTFTAPVSGAYEFVCTIHADSGMKGAVYVNDGDEILTTADGAGS